jgi:hypothetical protein
MDDDKCRYANSDSPPPLLNLSWPGMTKKSLGRKCQQQQKKQEIRQRREEIRHEKEDQLRPKRLCTTKDRRCFKEASWMHPGKSIPTVELCRSLQQRRAREGFEICPSVTTTIVASFDTKLTQQSSRASRFKKRKKICSLLFLLISQKLKNFGH